METAVVTIYDARTNFRSLLEEVRFPGHDDEAELVQLYEEKVAKRKWERTRKAMVTELIKEWTANPNASGDIAVFKDGESQEHRWR